ncbi:C4-dicarboxylate ABC transporter permease, partial [Halorubrum sp. SP9]
ANFWRTCGAAIRIAAPLFILPVAFVYNPGLISMDVGLNTLYVGLLVLLGAVTIIYGLNYPFKMRPGRKLGARALLATLGVLIMVYPSNAAKIAGIAVFAAVFVAEKVMI